MLLYPGATLDVTGLSGGTLALGSTQTLQGVGTVNGNLTNSGIVSPGSAGKAAIKGSKKSTAPFGVISVTGNYTQTASGALNIALGDSSQGEVNQLAVSGKATLGGTLNVRELGDFVDTLGTSYAVLTFGSRGLGADGAPSDFASRTGTILPSGNILDEVFSGTGMNLVENAPGTDVTSSVAITRGGFRVNTVTKHIGQVITIKNTGTQALSGPITLVLTGLSSKVSLYNRTGLTPEPASLILMAVAAGVLGLHRRVAFRTLNRATVAAT